MATSEGLNRISRWSDDNKSSLDAAKEAAAKVNTMLIAKGKLKPSQLSQQHGNKQMKVGAINNLVVAEVEINDVPIGCRNMLTRGSTQEEISKFSGAAVSTRGRYLTPEDRVRNMGDRPLYLCVQGPVQQSVDMAVARINEIITNGMKTKGTRFSPAIRPLPPPIQRPAFNQPPPLMSIPSMPAGMLFVQEKLFIGLEHAPPNFDVKGKTMGPGGSYLQHIQAETGARVTLRGKGSGFLEPLSGREAFEPMQIHIQHQNVIGLQQAKQLAENLIQTVQQDYAQFQQALVAMPPTIAAGPAAILAGLPHQPGPPGLMSPQQGLAGLTSVAQPPMQTHPGLQPVTSFPGLVNPVASSVVLPSSSALATPTTVFTATQGPGFLVPTSLGATSMTNIPMATSVYTDSFLSAGTSVTGAHPPSHQVLVQTTGPPPPHQITTLAPIGPPQLEAPVATTALVTTLQPELQLVTQPQPLPIWGAPPNIPQHLPPSSVYTQVNGQSGPGMTFITSAPVTVTTSSTYAYSTLPREEPKRRFTEEKQEDKVPENLLGYEHGPPHLTNLVVQGPPPPNTPMSQQQFQHVGDAPPMGLPGLPPGMPMVSIAPPGMPVEENRAVMGGVQVNNLLQQPHPPDSSHPPGQEIPDQDKKLMPPPPLPGMTLKRPGGERQGGVDRKKSKGALGSVSAYGSDEDDDDINSSMKQQQKEAQKYQYNQYSNAPQIYQQATPILVGDAHMMPPPPQQQGMPPMLEQHLMPLQQPPPQQQGMPPPPQQSMPPPPPQEQFPQGQYPPLPESPNAQQQQELIQINPLQHQAPFPTQPPPNQPFPQQQMGGNPAPEQTHHFQHHNSGPSPQFVNVSQGIAVAGPPPPIQRISAEQILPLPGQRLPEELPPPPLGLGQRLPQEQLQPPPPSFANMPPPPPNQSPQYAPQFAPQNPPQFAHTPGQQFQQALPPPPPPSNTMQSQPPIQFWMPN